MVRAVLHLKTGCIGPQENYTVDNSVALVLMSIVPIVLRIEKPLMV